MVPSIEQEIHDLHALFGSPRDPEGRAFVPLADAYRRSGDPSRALEILTDGLERHPQLAAGHLVEGLSRRDLADDAGAEAAFRRVLDLDADNARALVGLGRLVQARGDVAEGEGLVGRGLALDPLLSRVGAPDRVPRHSTNPEVVGAVDPGAGADTVEVDPAVADELAPLEWEVIEAGAAPEVVDLAALAPEGVVGPLDGPVDLDPGPVDAPDGPLPTADVATPPEAAAEAPSGDATDVDAGPAHPSAETGEVVVDVSDLSPGGGEATAGSGEATVEAEAEAPSAADGLRDDDPRDFLVSSDAEAALLDAVSGPEADEGVSAAAWSGGDLDIDWDVDGGAGDETGDELVMDAADLAPDDWSPDDELPDEAVLEVEAALPAESDTDDADAPADGADEGGAPVPTVEADEGGGPPPTVEIDEEGPGIASPGDDLLMELADLAPDIEPGTRRPDAGGDDEVLPTRTLGELYARQGLHGQAVKVFEELVARSPADPDLRARLDELRAARGGVEAPPPVEAADSAPPAKSAAVEADPGPPVSEFLAGLLSWTPDRTDDGAAD